MRDVFLRRQPILTRRLEVWAYEISVGRFGFVDLASGSERASTDSPTPTVPQSRAAFQQVREIEARLLFDALAEVGLPALVGDLPAVLRLTPGTVIATLDFLTALAAPSHLVVLLDLREPASEQRDLLPAAIEALHRAGFRVGLAGFAGQPELLPLARSVDLLALRCREVDASTFPSLVATLHGATIPWLVTDVETYEEFDRFREARATYFAGPFLAVPRPHRATRAPASRALLLLLARLQDPEVEFSELEALISLDVGLTYRLLRLVNSVWYGRRRIESVRQALLLLGTRLVSAWVTLLLMADIPEKPHELLVTAVIRARMAELIAAARGRASRESAFLVGLLSVLDALLDQPMADLLAALPLTDELRSALLERRGELGVVLDAVLAHERGDWARLGALGLRPSLVTSAYLDALALAREIDLALAA